MWGAHPPNQPVPADPNTAARFAAAARHLPAHTRLTPYGVWTVQPRNAGLSAVFTLIIGTPTWYIYVTLVGGAPVAPDQWLLEQWLFLPGALGVLAMLIALWPALDPGVNGTIGPQLATRVTRALYGTSVFGIAVLILCLTVAFARPGHTEPDQVAVGIAAIAALGNGYSAMHMARISKCLKLIN